jgi:hypothetical protein
MPADNGAQFDNPSFYKSVRPGEAQKIRFPRPAETPKQAFQVTPGSEVYVRGSDKSIDGRWIFEGADAEGMKVSKLDERGGKHVRHMTKQELEDLNRPTVLADIRGLGQKSIEDLVHVVRMLRTGDIADPNGVIKSEDQAQMLIGAYYGEVPLSKITDVGYLRQVLEHLMKVRQIRGELGEAAAAQVEPFVAAEDLAKQQVEAGVKSPGSLFNGRWVTVKRGDGRFEGGWKMREPSSETGEVMVIRMADNLPWDFRMVSLADLKKWNS